MHGVGNLPIRAASELHLRDHVGQPYDHPRGVLVGDFAGAAALSLATGQQARHASERAAIKRQV